MQNSPPTRQKLLERYENLDRDQKRRAAARNDLLAFTTYTFPGYKTNWHHAAIANALTRWAEGNIPRLMLCVGPRRGKSELASRRAPAFLLGRDPDALVMACSYGASLAVDMSRDVQRIMDGDAYKKVFPDTRLGTGRAGEQRTADSFQIVGRKGTYRSAGVGGPITGKGFSWGLVDDACKSRKEAESPTYRNAVWDWWNSDFYSRRDSDAAKILVIGTRWHSDDLQGRLLKQAEEDPSLPQWVVINLPEIHEGVPTVPEDPRSEGDVLWPERFSKEDVLATKKGAGEYVFSALYQQRPVPREGGLFKLAGLSHLVPASPAAVRSRVRFWDKGYSATGDWTVGVRMSHGVDGLFTIEDVTRFRESPEMRNKIILATAHADDQMFRKHVPVYVERPMGAGAETTANLLRLLQAEGIVCHAHQPRGDKAERAEPFAAAVEAGNVRLVKANWVSAFQSELCLFPMGENDDQADSASAAYLKLTEKQPFRVAIL